MTASAETIAVAREWLRVMERSVRELDFAGCRSIFAEDAIGFGTKAAMVRGVDALERDQWRHIWPNIREFTFEVESAEIRSNGNRSIWIACPWTSQRQNDEGHWMDRPGRMTAVLEQDGDRWLAVHTHHSLVP